MHKIIIDRLLWLRGEGPEASRLIRSHDEKACCLGFAGEQLSDIPSDELLDKEYFTKDDALPEQLNFLVSKDNDLPSHEAFALMIANDIEIGEECPSDWEFPDRKKPFKSFQSEAEREDFLTAEFLKHGIEVEFIN